MNNTTPIKILTAAVLLTFGFALTANAALINKGVTEMNHEYTVSDTLSARQQAIPLIAASMASSQMDKLNAALNQGLDAGLTINEAKEILIQLYAYTGFPRSLNALNELMKVVETRKQRGIEDIEGKAPIAPIPVGDELRRVGTANQTKISGAPVQGPLFDFAPTINQFLQTHLFGDIFARDNLDWQSRELATVKGHYARARSTAKCGLVIPRSEVHQSTAQKQADAAYGWDSKGNIREKLDTTPVKPE
ncbi:TPA: carboxymuconolactone decarboxylase family protein [Escherichia coli]